MLPRLLVHRGERGQQMPTRSPLMRTCARNLAVAEVLGGDAEMRFRMPKLVGRRIERRCGVLPRIAHSGCTLTSQMFPSIRSARRT